MSILQIRNDRGPLKVSGSNARYFTDNSGKAIVLAGSHTWDNRQDQGAGAFDWDGYLADLVSWGHNFVRFWVWEQAKNITTWPAPVNSTTTLTPEIWLRTGPGNAADGGLAFDLTQYNQSHFDRLRDRILQMRQRGFYVCVMLFDGWSVAQKSAGDNPWTHHPFENGNNINSIDGDTDDDGAGYEIQDNSISAAVTLQKAYIDKVLATVDDLDNVFYEIANEPSATAGAEAWVAGMITYLQSQTDKPVWYTVEWPDGSNATLLASDAEAISPNSDVTCDGTKVVIVDTDHYFGIGGSADWAWQQFCRGSGGVAYMDSYDNLFLDASGSGHPIQSFRDNLGYIVTLANLADVINTAPQGGGTSPCQTGHCLYGNSQYICYQPDSGNFNLDLSSESGTFNIRKVNVADGTIDNEQTTTGGDVRAITQPTGWTSGWAAWVRK